MITLDSGGQLFASDFVQLKDYNIYSTVEKFAFEVTILLTMYVSDKNATLAEEF